MSYTPTKPLRTRKCAHCPQLFSTRDLRTKFCSYECSRTAYRIARRIMEHVPDRTCIHCGKPFRPYTRLNIVCSRRCHDLFQTAAKAKEYQRRKLSTKNICEECRQRFTPRTYLSERYCSIQCCRRKTQRDRNSLDPIAYNADRSRRNKEDSAIWDAANEMGLIEWNGIRKGTDYIKYKRSFITALKKELVE